MRRIGRVTPEVELFGLIGVGMGIMGPSLMGLAIILIMEGLLFSMELMIILIVLRLLLLIALSLFIVGFIFL
jgi:hypothetical protein